MPPLRSFCASLQCSQGGRAGRRPNHRRARPSVRRMHAAERAEGRACANQPRAPLRVHTLGPAQPATISVRDAQASTQAVHTALCASRTAGLARRCNRACHSGGQLVQCGAAVVHPRPQLTALLGRYAEIGARSRAKAADATLLSSLQLASRREARPRQFAAAGWRGLARPCCSSTGWRRCPGEPKRLPQSRCCSTVPKRPVILRLAPRGSPPPAPRGRGAAPCRARARGARQPRAAGRPHCAKSTREGQALAGPAALAAGKPASPRCRAAALLRRERAPPPPSDARPRANAAAPPASGFDPLPSVAGTSGWRR